VTGRQDGSVMVIGAGILGCSIAVHLADRGVLPVLVDAERPGQGTSSGSFASVSAFGKDPATYFQLACAGVSGWTRFAERLGGEVGLRRAGEVRWAADPEEGRRLATLVADARERGYPVRPVDQAEVARLLPDTQVGPVTVASFAPNDGQVEPALVLAACRAELQEAGAQLLTGRARVQLDDDGMRVQVRDEVLYPRTTVLAAGAEAVEVAAEVGLDIPTVSSLGMLAQTQPLPPITDRVVYLPGGPGPAVSLRQRADGSVLVGERTQETPVTDPGAGHARDLLTQAARFFPVLAGVPVVAVLAGHALGPAADPRPPALAGLAVPGGQPQRGHPGPGPWPAGRQGGRRPDRRRPPEPVPPRPVRRAHDPGDAGGRVGLPRADPPGPLHLIRPGTGPNTPSGPQ